MFNIFGVVLVAIVGGIVLSIIATRKHPPGQLTLVPPEDDYEKHTHKEMPFPSVIAMAEKICGENGLNILQRMKVSDREQYWISENESPVFQGKYVFGFFEVSSERPFVPLSVILEFKDFIKSVGSTKGFYFTNGFFTRDVHQPLEGPGVALYNAKRIAEDSREQERNSPWPSGK
jgi:hypothetical protein